ncbi:DoxX family protein [Candidatus Nomurabacteria bacterium]|nr:DoxX family protein [Candidatus Nomurabacteria bacterium]
MKISLHIRGTTFLRIGISIVILWFGVQQFLDPTMWVGFIPDFIIKLSPVSPTTLVHLNGALELVFGSALLLGFFTRISALILALHLLDITLTIGLDSIGMRDLGLTLATFAIFLNGADYISLDRIFFFKPEEETRI